jgi:site-specific DNA recombinase
MKKRAILYIRVSSDDQIRGYSLASQEERLRKWCELNGVEDIAIFNDDHSARSFDRPEFKKLMEFARKNKGNVDALYFVNWSRFSRNISEAYNVIGQLKKLNIEVQAIEQPLNFDIPESKLMLAFYLAEPEVENDRRSINIKHGIHRARKEGRYASSARIGYKNERDEQKRSIIVPSKDAPLIVEAFEEMAKGLITQKELYLQMRRKGLKCSANNFYSALINPIYCGKVFVPASKDEKGYFIQGIHEPLISEELFNKVQDIIAGRRFKRPAVNVTRREELPMRGFLGCPRCGRSLTGSASKGNGGKYFYYHCNGGCKERYKAEEANEEFLKELRKIRANAEVLEAYYEALKEKFGEYQKDNSKTIQRMGEEIKKHEARIKNAQLLMIDTDIDMAEYRSIKKTCEEAINKLAKEKAELENTDSDYVEYLSYSVEVLKKIDYTFETADLPVKQKIIGSICPEKLFFENKKYRTKRINSVVALIAVKNSKLFGHKKGLNEKSIIQSSNVVMIGIEPTTQGFSVPILPCKGPQTAPKRNIFLQNEAKSDKNRTPLSHTTDKFNYLSVVISKGVSVIRVANLKVNRIQTGQDEGEYTKHIPVTKSLKALLNEMGYQTKNTTSEFILPRTELIQRRV